MKIPKLTDEELSRVLSQADAGLLHYMARFAGNGPEVACVATTAFAWTRMPYYNEPEAPRGWEVSNFSGEIDRNCSLPPDKLLRELERVGLA